ncbi:syntaxin-binding protein 5-like isoform X2 [Ruditapes philippinarum]|uniref:syntaxin-binding protein 5-like isoform X2 n=1 Tax=Ruditapes philippinarum TaxID=129788 RepID=UPI00295B910C|nr:syntaxin-binding protein 5-like isoform X2 [Ruditapes philippinarum]
MSGKMKKIRGMLDGLRQSVGSSSPKSEAEIEETLRSEDLQVCKTVRHGFPYQPTSLAFDNVQKILAIGTKSGSLRILGQPGVDLHCHHGSEVAVQQILFLINEGALVTCCSDDSLHLWNFRQKRPEIVHSLKFQREKITHCQLSFQSKWLYVGTERGNVHIVNIESFTLSGYVINWNKAIELSRKTHPGPVLHLSDNPLDPGKLLVGFESGAIVLWDLKNKTADCRYQAPESLRSISWHHEGKQFMSSHTDGSLLTWNIKSQGKPVSIITPHAKVGKDGRPDACKAITKVAWKSPRSGLSRWLRLFISSDPLVIFSGGMSYDRAGRTPCITVMSGKNTTVLEMEHTIIDFVVLCETPWQNDFQDPYAIAVLLQNDLVVIDLTSQGYPCFENPYPMDIHESPVTACQYFADCQTDLIPALYSVGTSKHKRTGFSEKRWPIKGGEWGTATCSYPEIIVTGHADGSLKFWDASAVTLQVLYKVKTAKIFEKPKNKVLDGQEDDPFAIYMIYLDQESRLLTLAGATHVMLFKFSKQESSIEVPSLEVSIVYEVFDDLDSPDLDYPKPSLGVATQQHSGSVGSYSSNTSDSTKPEQITALRVRSGARKWGAGYQPDIVCLLTWMDSEHPGNITSISINSSYGLLAFGNESGLAIVDIIQKTCLLNLGTPDLYGSMDPYQRAPRSPRGKKPMQPQPLDGSNPALNDEGARSPTSDQPTSPDVLSPVAPPRKRRTSKQLHITNEAKHDSGPNTAPPSGTRFDYNNLSLSSQYYSDSSNVTSPTDLSPGVVVIPPTPLVLRKDVESENHIEGKNMEVLSPVIKKAMTVRTSSLPLVPATDNETSNISERKKCKSHEDILKAEKNVVEFKAESPQVKIIDSDTESKHHLGHKYSIKKFKQRFRHGKKHDKNGERRRKHSSENESDIPSEAESYSYEDAASQGSRSENEDSILTDDDGIAGGDDAMIEKKNGFFRRMSVKMKQLVLRHDEDEETELEKKVKKREEQIVLVNDLTEDNSNSKPLFNKMTVRDLVNGSHDKNDGSSFSRSRSSSMSSLENVSKEAIQCLVFADSYTRKFDNFTSPCLWVGTSLGSVLVIVLNLPPSGEQRLSQPVIVSPSGTIFRLKGAIQCMSFLDCNGMIIPTVTSGAWRDSSKDDQAKNSKTQNATPQKLKISPSSSTEVTDRQFAIICSEKQARVVSLPSQTCPYKARISESSFVIKADVVNLRGESVCLACYVANGHIMVYSLPSLKLLLDVNFLALTDLRVARTFCFSNHGHAMYMCSPTELQKITYSADFCDNLNEMLGELFLPTETPDAPKQSFFKNLFGGGPSALDREELFGEGSGKVGRNIATRVPGSGGMQNLQAQAQAAVGGEVGRARLLLGERGEKLSGLGDKTEEMSMQAEAYANTAHQLMLKYKDKKWYQF